ncbi:sporulation histidine kinase inhibitor Sda [Shouchella patagoniensis]|nr:sporulation histidine kinase inhibitor Sda [Shouchella patagoniensis]
MSLKELPDSILKEAYVKAKNQNLQEDFVAVLKDELINRKIDFTDDPNQ